MDICESYYFHSKKSEAKQINYKKKILKEKIIEGIGLRSCNFRCEMVKISKSVKSRPRSVAASCCAH